MGKKNKFRAPGDGLSKIERLLLLSESAAFSIVSTFLQENQIELGENRKALFAECVAYAKDKFLGMGREIYREADKTKAEEILRDIQAYLISKFHEKKQEQPAA